MMKVVHITQITYSLMFYGEGCLELLVAHLLYLCTLQCDNCALFLFSWTISHHADVCPAVGSLCLQKVNQSFVSAFCSRNCSIRMREKFCHCRQMQCVGVTEGLANVLCPLQEMLAQPFDVLDSYTSSLLVTFLFSYFQHPVCFKAE